MTNKDIKNALREEIEKQVPDVLDNILLNCEEKESVKMKKKQEKVKNIKVKRINPFLSMAALAVFVLLIAISGYQGYNMLYNKTDSIIEFDVNPSVELKVNDRERIISATPLNEDGKKILGDMDLRKSDLDVGVNAIIGAMYKEGYISDIKNSVLVSVHSDDKAKSSRIQEEISKRINEILKGYSIDSSVITQEYLDNSDIALKAKQNGISKGKAEFIDNIIDEGLANKRGEKYTFETLSKLSINELNAILNSKNKTAKNTTSTGKASTKGYIGMAKAKSIALSNAGVSESSTRELEVDFDYDYGKLIYEVSFETSYSEYEYDIDAKTGAIINREVDGDDYRPATSSSANNSSSTGSSGGVSSSRKANTSTKTGSYIGTSKARSIALSNAGMSAGSARELEVDFDYERGRAVYEVNFKAGGKEYDYDIDAKTGSIIHRSIEIDD